MCKQVLKVAKLEGSMALVHTHYDPALHVCVKNTMMDTFKWPLQLGPTVQPGSDARLLKGGGGGAKPGSRIGLGCANGYRSGLITTRMQLLVDVSVSKQ